MRQSADLPALNAGPAGAGPLLKTSPHESVQEFQTALIIDAAFAPRAAAWRHSPLRMVFICCLECTAKFFFLLFPDVSVHDTPAWKALVPGMELPGALKIILIPMIWVIELLGLFIKHGVLSVRLFANIMAGHTVIAVILGFIAAAADTGLFIPVAIASVFGQVAIGMLELFVAFLQAYIFAFLATLFIGAAVHPH